MVFSFDFTEQVFMMNITAHVAYAFVGSGLALSFIAVISTPLRLNGWITPTCFAVRMFIVSIIRSSWLLRASCL